MAPQKEGLPKGATLRVRLYRPEDHDEVARIFSAGMMGLVPVGVEEITRADTRLQAAAVAVPVVALALARRCSLLTKLGVGLLSTAVVPAAIYVLVRSLFAKYVKKSLEDDLANIERFYSTHGAGAGSAFWVAELVEPVGELGSAASGSGSLPAFKRTFSTGLLSYASPSTAEGAAAAASMPVAAPAAVVSNSPAPAAQAKSAPPQPQEPLEAGQTSGTHGTPTAATAVTSSAPSCSEQAPLGASTSTTAAAAQEPVPSSSVAPEAAASGAGAVEAEDPDAEARRVVAGLVAAAVRRLEAASAAAATPAPSSSALQASAGPKANGSSSAAASGLASPRSGGSAVKKLSAAPMPLAPAVQVAIPADATPKLPLGVPAAGASPSPAAAKLATPMAALAASASLPRTPSSAAFGAATAPAVRTRVVGHVALERKTWQVAELRRMSVAPEFRGAGVGRALLATLTAHARDVGFRELVLYTSSLQLPAHRLYERAGWTLTERVPESGIEIFTYKYNLTKKP